MFKVGDFVCLKADHRCDFIVTRELDGVYMAVGNFDVLDGWIENEFIVKRKYFESVALDSFIVPGMSYRQMLKNFIDAGYFSRNPDGLLILDHTEDSRKGVDPMLGLNLLFYPLDAIN